MTLNQDFLSHIGYRKGQTVAIAVSGGSDSLALLFMACEKLGSQNIVAITFNHRLRKEAYDEAMFVKSQCEKLKCKHILLEPIHSDNIKASQNSARIARYQHILSYCHAYKIHYLFLAHHLNDQIETYYIRLYQNSHLWGLASMPTFFQKGNIFIVRPFLNRPSSYLKSYLQNKNIKWIEDPTNQNDKYLRVKIRKLLEKQELEIPDLKTIQSYKENILAILKKWLAQYAQSSAAGIISIKKDEFNKLHKELRLHLLRFCIQAVGHSEYSVSLKEISQKYVGILSPNLFSLSHCLIFSDSQYVYIQHEYRKKNKARFNFFQKNYIFYDKRFHIFYPESTCIQIDYVGDLKKSYIPELQRLIELSKKKRYRFIKSLPIVKYNEREYILPAIKRKIWQQEGIYINYDNQMEAMTCQKYFIGLSF